MIDIRAWDYRLSKTEMIDNERDKSKIWRGG
jgi:hypothetical protein